MDRWLTKVLRHQIRVTRTHVKIRGKSLSIPSYGLEGQIYQKDGSTTITSLHGLALVNLHELITFAPPYCVLSIEQLKKDYQLLQRCQLALSNDNVWYIGARYSHSEECNLWKEDGTSTFPIFADWKKMYEKLTDSTVQLVHVTTTNAMRVIMSPNGELKPMNRAYICAMALTPQGYLPKKSWEGKFGRKEYNTVLELDVSSIIKNGIDILVAGDVFLVTKPIPNKFLRVSTKN